MKIVLYSTHRPYIAYLTGLVHPAIVHNTLIIALGLIYPSLWRQYSDKNTQSEFKSDQNGYVFLVPDEGSTDRFSTTSAFLFVVGFGGCG